MTSSSSSSSSSGVGASGLLFVAFVVLKLTGYIDWSWWWVCAPIWIPAVLVVVGLGIFFGWQAIKDKRRKAARTKTY